jgi:hypothetical protein
MTRYQIPDTGYWIKKQYPVSRIVIQHPEPSIQHPVSGIPVWNPERS